MKKILIVARWEFLEKIKTKAFLISIILTPIILVTFSLAPTLLTNEQAEHTKAIGIIDTSTVYIDKMIYEMSKYEIENHLPNYVILNLTNKRLSLDSLKKVADKAVFKNKIDGYILILNSSTDSVKLEYRTQSAGNFRDEGRIESAFNKIRIALKLTAEKVKPDIINLVSKKINLTSIKIEENGKEGKADFLVIFFSSFIFILLLMMMTIYSGQMLVRSLIEEKSNRLIEILISSCSAEELLTGKILGLSLLGLFQIFIWSVIGLSLAGSSVIPYSAFDHLFILLLYFVMGFVFYSAIFVGVGSIVSTEQEAQQITSYLNLFIILPVVLAVPAIQNPNSLLVSILSYIPFTLPSIMLIRINTIPIPIWEILFTVTIMLGSIYFVILISAKIFKIGILSYGKRPSLKEVIEWIRSK